MKRAFILHNVDKIKDIKFDDNSIVISLSSDVSDILSKNNIKYKSIDNYSKSNESNYIKWMKSWSKSEIGKKFITTLELDGFSLWWFMDTWLYYSPVTSEPLRDTFIYCDIIDDIKKKEAPDEIVFIDDGSSISEVIKIVFADKKLIPIRKNKTQYRNFITKYFLNHSSIIRKIVSKKKPVLNNEKKKIIVFSTVAYEHVENINNNKTIEPFTYNLIEKLKQNDKYNIKIINVPVGKFLSLSYLLSKRNQQDVDIIENYFDKDAYKKTAKNIKKIRYLWNELRKNDEYNNSFLYRNYNLSNIFCNKFDSYFDVRMPSHIKDFYTLESMINKEKPSIIVYPTETTEFSRGMFYLSKKHGIPCVTMQHGVGLNNIGCIHDKGEISYKIMQPFKCQLPTTTFVFGQYFKNMLEKQGSYPRNGVVVTGSPKFDRTTNSFDKKWYLKQIGLDENKKTIVFATSPTDKSNRDAMMNAIMHIKKKISNIQLIIKIHQGENLKDYEIVNKIEGIALLRDSDLYQILNTADIFITHLSSAGLEAMIFDKPVIILNLTGLPDRINYVKDCVAFGAYSIEQLENTINDLINKNTYLKIRKRVKKYVYKTTYKSDGKATERITKIISSLIK